MQWVYILIEQEKIVGDVTEALSVGSAHTLHALLLLASGPLLGIVLHAAADESVAAR